MNEPKLGEVLVVRKEGASEHRLRIYLSAGDAGTVMFETDPEFSKGEADYRAVQIARQYGLRFGELPTHPYQMPYPKESQSHESRIL